jgi:hypothetical protein
MGFSLQCMLASLLMSRLVLLSWAFTCQTFIMAVFISLLYWAILFDWDSRLTYGNFFVHASQVSF